MKKGDASILCKKAHQRRVKRLQASTIIGNIRCETPLHRRETDEISFTAIVIAATDAKDEYAKL